MLDINLIRSDSAKVSAALAKKGYKVDFAEMLGWDAERKAAKQSVEELKAKRNKVSAEIPKLKKAGEPVEKIFEEMRALGDEIAAEDARIAELEGKINDFLLGLPNMPDDDLLAGEKENNQVIKVVGKPTEFGFKPKNHVDLCVDLGLIDYERGVKLAASGFTAAWARDSNGRFSIILSTNTSRTATNSYFLPISSAITADWARDSSRSSPTRFTGSKEKPTGRRTASCFPPPKRRSSIFTRAR